MVGVQDFLQDSSTARHFVSKLVTTYVSNITGYVYLVSASKQMKPTDSYENYSKMASFKIKNCPCQMPLCYATGMTGMFPIGHEVATYVDHNRYMWVMPSRVTVLSMQDKETALQFLSSYFDKPIQEMIFAAGRTAFYTVMCMQLKQIGVASTRALLNLDLIIFTLFYAIHNRHLTNEIFRAYCIVENPWDLLAEYDGIWGRTPGSWTCRFLAFDALHTDDPELKEKFTRVRLPLISSISRPYNVPQLAIVQEHSYVYYKTELIGELIMEDGDMFWLVNPVFEFLSGKAVMPSESFQLLVTTDGVLNDFNWGKYMEELRTGRWRRIPLHREFVNNLDKLLETYFLIPS